MDFTQLFLLNSLRMVVRMALAWGRVHHTELQRLLSLAIYLELKERGFNQSNIGALAGVADAGVSSWAKWNKNLDMWDAGPTMVERIYRDLILAKGKMSKDLLIRFAEDEKWYIQTRFDRAIKLLVKTEHVTVRKEGGDDILILNVESGLGRNFRFHHMMEERDKAFGLGMELVYLVHKHGTLTRSDLDRYAKVERNQEGDLPMEEAITRMLDLGALERSGEGEGVVYQTSTNVNINPRIREARHRVGLKKLIQYFGIYFEEMMGEPEDRLLSNKSLTFKIAKKDVPKMLKERHEAVLAIVEKYVALEEELMEGRLSGEGQGISEIITYRLTNLGSPITG